MSLPIEYRQARQALAKVTDLAKATSIRAKAIGLQAYAAAAKDRDLIGHSVEARKWAERRIGELMDDERKAGKLKHGGDRRSRVSRKPLKNVGIDKNLANRSRKAAAMSEAKFIIEVDRAKKIAVATCDGLKEVISAARAERHEQKGKKRRQREAALGAKIIALPVKKYGVILADPEWKFEFRSDKGKTNSSADNHYDTSDLEKIKARKVGSIAAKDCVLFLWGTVPMLPQAIEVMEAWGFTYKTNFSWTKHKAGTGYWNRNKHEHLLLGTRGNPPAPADGTQWESVIEAKAGRHSEKPEDSYKMIEEYFPTLPKVELNQRKARKGWDGWGHEAPMAEAAE